MNAKAVSLISFLSGVIITWCLFHINVFVVNHPQHIDMDAMFLTNYHQMACKSPSEGRNEAALAEKMEPLLGKHIKPDNPSLLTVIKEAFIDYPRPLLTKYSMPIIMTPQAVEVDSLLKGKLGGFFVECGALDGERSSNTNWLEQKKGWGGLLVEMDPSYYMQIRGKNRKSMSINACLSPHKHPVKMDFKEHHMGEGRLVTEDGTKTRGDASVIHTTYCFPLYSIMLSLNRTKIDYFSLDVEGMELPILETIPFDKLDISVLSVEYNHGQKGEKAYVQFMQSRGYKVHKRINYFKKELYLGVNDYIFVKESLKL